MNQTVTIIRANSLSPEAAALLAAHAKHGSASAPQDSDHTLDPAGLTGADIRFYLLYQSGQALGCGALKSLSDGTSEVKSVHVAASARGLGFAGRIMQHLEAEARAAGATALVLETGSPLCPGYDAARRLYEKLGFEYCGPLPGYQEDPMSVFMRRGL